MIFTLSDRTEICYRCAVYLNLLNGEEKASSEPATCRFLWASVPLILAPEMRAVHAGTKKRATQVQNHGIRLSDNAEIGCMAVKYMQ